MKIAGALTDTAKGLDELFYQIKSLAGGKI
ncbi:hypothetical protein PAP_07355 [Palaeococcus pacificus DY20341]|uniref:Uncharacterized protein n=1 Tax=Palaeococcus pacificus DY20341 TaxID=1343739 RepID=A0A075LUP1_9EURY|nr:hypothetical protein PAP_07355 [Palaeococcus pacificus DY20341]